MGVFEIDIIVIFTLLLYKNYLNNFLFENYLHRAAH